LENVKCPCKLLISLGFIFPHPIGFGQLGPYKAYINQAVTKVIPAPRIY